MKIFVGNLGQVCQYFLDFSYTLLLITMSFTEFSTKKGLLVSKRWKYFKYSRAYLKTNRKSRYNDDYINN